MAGRKKAPAAFVMNGSNPVLARGAALPGLTIDAVNTAEECLIACGVPEIDQLVAPKAPLLKIQTRTSVLTADRKRLSPWAKRLVRSVYDRLKIVEEETASTLTHV